MLSFDELSSLVTKNTISNENTKKVHIIINYDMVEWDEYMEYLMTLTWYTGIRHSKNGGKNSQNILFAQTLDEGLALSVKYDYAMISYIGTYYNEWQERCPDTIFAYFDKFCESDLPCRGHILWHPEKQYGRMHFQSMFMNLKHWRSIGCPKVSGNYTGKVMVPERSPGNVHDDYTPFWLKPSEKYTTVVNCAGAEYISKVLESGKTILNYDNERRTKFFAYPSRKNKGISCESLEFERNKNANIVYVRNNELLHKNVQNVKKYDVIYAPASGQMSEYFVEMVGHKDTKLVVYDYNDYSIKWKKMIYEFVDTIDDIDRVNRFFKKDKNCMVDDCSYSSDTIKNNMSSYDDSDWIKTIHSIKNNTDIIKYDVVRSPPFDVDPNKRNLICLSNIFSYRFLLHDMRLEDIHKQFQKYLSLPNTTIVGRDVFKNSVIHTNHENAL